jgi:7,8-dihydropterin-6-yl-methyl-4-(beta-D-ribofuranosyl)aminobenzene 5'-phosphate synthase
VISHNHWDHTGGLADFLNVNPSVIIYAPALDQELILRAERAGAEIRLISEPVSVFDGVWTTGVFLHPLPEQALILETSLGHVVLTGCSHPGVVNLVLAAPRPRYLVTGGFHLFRSTTEAIRATAFSLDESGVEFVAPSHCTGDAAMEYFRQYFGERFLYGGLGATFEL